MHDHTSLQGCEPEAGDEELARDYRGDHPAGEDAPPDEHDQDGQHQQLSATGSRSDPSGEDRPRLRATRPSNQSVVIARDEEPGGPPVMAAEVRDVEGDDERYCRDTDERELVGQAHR